MADTKAVMIRTRKFVTNLLLSTKQFGRKRTKVETANKDETALGDDDGEKIELPLIPNCSDISVTQNIECSNYVDSIANGDAINEDDKNKDTSDVKTPLDYAKNLVNDDDNDKDSAKDLVFSFESKQVNEESGIEHNESKETVMDSSNQKDTEKVDKPRRGRKRKKVDSPKKFDFVDVEIKEERGSPLSSKNLVGLTLESKVKEEISVFEECTADKGTCKLIKSPRGRKRKNSQSNECDKVNGAGKEVKHDTVHIVGRVLRSRTNVKNEHVKIKKEADLTEAESENDESPRPIKKRRKKVKGRRGRPPKNQGQNGVSVSKVVCKKKVQIIAPNSKKKVKLEANSIDKKLKKEKENQESEMSRREQKQLVRDQIVSILMKAGWTIEYRRRQNKDYSDAVYVDCDGKTHWSVTLAYRKFKEKVENGGADIQTVSAYTPIPEETVNILKKKGGGKKIKKVQEKGKNMKKSTSKGKKKKVDKLHKKQKSEERRGRKPIALLARKSDVGPSDGLEGYNGKIGLFSWMIDLGVVVIGSKVNYMNPNDRKVMISGKITRDGIHCGCCHEIVSTYDFETHSGCNEHERQLYNNIYLESGISMLQCLAESWNKEMESRCIGFCHVDIDGKDPNDDTCNICGDGGHLFCCDGCPSTFHKNCLEIDKFPSGEWRCVYCSCKFCKTVNDCNEKDCSELSTCRMCEEKFHIMCTEVKDDDSKYQSFCGKKCTTMFENLQNLLGVKQDLEDGYSWTLLRRFEIDEDISVNNSTLKIECNSKLAVACSIMDECFMPIIDERSEINMINNIVYGCGSNIKRLNYSGFVTAILERGDEIISAASIRIHGNQLAEMPFIGTRHMYRRQGMCRRLLNAIESALSFLDVKKLVIPAISELLETWMSVFGFEQIEEVKRKEMKCLSMVVFPRVDMLQKPILNTLASGEEKVTDEFTGASRAIVLDESGANDVELSSQIGSDITNFEEKAIQIGSDITNFEEKAIKIGCDLTNFEDKTIQIED